MLAFLVFPERHPGSKAKYEPMLTSHVSYFAPRVDGVRLKSRWGFSLYEAIDSLINNNKCIYWYFLKSNFRDNLTPFLALLHTLKAEEDLYRSL